MPTRISRFDFEWWIIQKRMIYFLVAILIMSGLAAGAALYVWKYGNPLKDIGTNLKASAGARFISFEGDVRIIRAATRETIRAGSDTELYPGDTVQTGASGRARLGMADGSTLVVRPDSTIIVRDNASTDDGKKTNVHVVVDSGQMFVRTEKQPAGTNNVVETPKTTNKVGGQTNASFGVNPEGTEEIRVNTGVIQTTDSSGSQTAISGGQYASVNPSGTLSKPQKLLDVPSPLEPHDLQKVPTGANGAANVTLKWQRPQSGIPAYYRVEVATSPFFVANGKVVERDQLMATEFAASEMRPGTYFWRVRATEQSGQTSDWSEAQKFVVAVRGTGSVALSNLSAELLGGNIYLVRGRAETGTTVRVNDRETVVSTDRAFQLQITVSGDAQEITLEADDPQGNSSQFKVPLRGRGRGG
ncbi:MAG TPA: FecR domain-containing protein [Pyrinomonadaceae bacterium]|nr:FecR domain-containing protein [Pyrinomonadaceae bacterium]